MEKITLRDIENAFLPSKHIINTNRFAGRKEYIKKSFLSLLSEGSNIAIVGDRGIGKSSLARQIINISKGDNTLIDKLEIYVDCELDFLTIYFACDEFVSSIEDLLIRLLTTEDCLLKWLYKIPKTEKEVEKLNAGLNLNVIKGAAESTSESSLDLIIKEHKTVVIFQNVISFIVESNKFKDGILIIIDEFDKIKNVSGFASLLKSLATNVPKLKFCLVGIASDIQSLLKEHGSIDRLFAGGVINLPSMTEDELTEVIGHAESSINNFIEFSDEALRKIIQLSNGHPYITHLIGKQAFRTSYFNEIYEIDSLSIDEALKEIAENEADQFLEVMYKKAVASSYQREAVLKSLADSVRPDGEIHTSEAYGIAGNRNVVNPSKYVGQLVSNDFGAEIIKVRERYYRFRDSLFQTYVKLRPWLFQD